MAEQTRLKRIWESTTRIWADTWVIELFMVGISLCCLTTVIVILMLADGITIRDWSGFTLNTLVSILSTASKAAATLTLSSSVSQWCWIIFLTQRRRLIDFEAFDNASRGPLGCIELLWRTRRGSLVWIGAITVIAGIAFDPFTQQLVQYKSSSTHRSSSQAWISRAERYSRGQMINVLSLLDLSRNKTSYAPGSCRLFHAIIGPVRH